MTIFAIYTINSYFVIEYVPDMAVSFFSEWLDFPPDALEKNYSIQL